MKPNCFVHLHQLQRKLKVMTELDPEEATKSLTIGSMSSYGLTPAEAAATVNLLKYLDPSHTAELAKIAAVHGMWKGPFSHKALAATSLRMNFLCPEADGTTTYKIRNTPEMVHELIGRVYQVWKAAPLGMKKTAGSETVDALQKLVLVHAAVKAEFAKVVPESVYASEVVMLDKNFMDGSMDTSYQDIFKAMPEPLDLNLIPEIRFVLAKLKTTVEKEQMARKKELQRQVNDASFQALRDDLLTDITKIEEYHQAVQAFRGSWENRVRAHKRRRRSNGLEAVAQLMNTRLRVSSLEKTQDILNEFSEFKKQCEKAFPACTGKRPG